MNRIKNIICIALPLGIAFYIIYPLISGAYFYYNPEYNLYKSFMVNFIELLRKGELPVWNAHIGGGYPAMYFGHYPISQNTVFYILFGFNDFTCYLAKFLNLIILFFTFIYACKYLKLSYLVALIGALTYFSINLVCRFFIADTVGNLFFIYPLLLIMIIKIVDENKTKDILLFGLFYILWLSGGHITYVYIHLTMLSVLYLITVWVFYSYRAFKIVNLKKWAFSYFILFIIPFLAVLYQYYFVYDVISVSNRLEEGLVVSPFDPGAWKQFIITFTSSSYFWVGLFLILVYIGLNSVTKKYGFKEAKRIKIPLWPLLLLIPFLFGISYIFTNLITKNFKKKILINSEFENNTNGWIAYKSNLLRVAGGKSGDCLQIETTEDATGYAYFVLPTKIGKEYKITAYFKRTVPPHALGQIKVGTSIDDTSLYYSGILSDANWTKYSSVFTATTKTAYITLVSLTPSKGQGALFDNVTVAMLGPFFADSLMDYLPILSSSIFWIALILYVIIIYFILYKNGFTLSVSSSLNWGLIFIAYISLLSYYLFSPSNILGYDYLFFKELSSTFRIIFILFVLYSLKEYPYNKVIKITVLSSIALYLIRSHFTIPLLRFTGIIWYAVRDGSIFSVFFAVLFMFGLKNFFSDLSNLFKHKGKTFVKYIRYSLLLFVLALLVRDSFNKIYQGTSNRIIHPNRIGIANTPTDKLILEKKREHLLLDEKLLALNKQVSHFYRIFTPELTTNEVLAGQLQHHKIYESAIYESSISRELKDLFDYTILGKIPVRNKQLKDLMQCSVFTRHVHRGLDLEYNEISYSHLFTLLSFPKDIPYIKSDNFDFFFDLMQVKYLIIGPEFSKVLANFSDYNENYKFLYNYPKLNLSLYQINKNKSYSQLAVYPLEGQEDYKEAIAKINSKDVQVLKNMYSKLLFLDQGNKDFNLLKDSTDNNSKRYYEINAKIPGILIDFESWNRNWRLKINNKDERLEKAFQIFKGIQIRPGINQIKLTYNLKYFKGLFFLSLVIILIYVVLLIRVCVRGGK